MSHDPADEVLSSETESISSGESKENADFSLSRSSDEQDNSTKKKKKDKGKNFMRRIPFLAQSIVFSIAYLELSKLFLRLLNKYVLKTDIKFEWNIYRFVNLIP